MQEGYAVLFRKILGRTSENPQKAKFAEFFKGEVRRTPKAKVVPGTISRKRYTFTIVKLTITRIMILAKTTLIMVTLIRAGGAHIGRDHGLVYADTKKERRPGPRRTPARLL
jgi:hypothetical protein